MKLFKSKEGQEKAVPAPLAPRMPFAGERLTLRAEGSTRLWLAAARTVAPDTLGVEIDLRAHQECRDTIKSGELVHVSGLADQPVWLHAEARGHNGTVVLLHDITKLEERPARQLARIPVRGTLWVTSSWNPSGTRVEVFDISLGGLCVRSPQGVRAGDPIGLAVAPGPHAALARGAVTNVRTAADGSEVLHVGFLAGTTPEALATLIDGLAEHREPIAAAAAGSRSPEGLLSA